MFKKVNILFINLLIILFFILHILYPNHPHITDYIGIILVILSFFNFVAVEYKIRRKINDEFSYNIRSIIHDIKEPIHSLSMLAEMLKAQLERCDIEEELLNTFYNNVKILYNYVESNKQLFLNDFKGEKTTTNVEDLILLTQRLNAYSFQDIDLKIYNCKNQQITTYTYSFIRIIQNILTNIIFHNDVDEILIKCTGNSIKFLFKPKDNPKFILRTIKSKYYIAKLFYTGTGLSIIHRIVKKLNMKIKFYIEDIFVVTEIFIKN